jgi:hypothetical protein
MLNLIKIFPVVFIAFSCSCLYTNVNETDPKDGEPKQIQIKTNDSNLYTDPSSIINAEIQKDILTLVVRYGGGCKDHEFELYWDGLFMESEPVQVRLELSHNSNGDLCRALLTDELSFSLSKIKTRFKENYGGSMGLVVINILEPDSERKTHSLHYSFSR